MIYEESKMNLEQERPFVCSAPGCSQRFPTEDHLMIHRHKHEMTLKFPSIKTDSMLSDQTPTPTRFLKNCEEVGLFNELDCSLEHEFRKAQEEESSKRNISMHNTVGGAMAGPGAHQLGSTRMPNHDTSVVIQQAMPSPQSSSVITQAPSTNRQIGPVPGSLSSLLHLHNRQRQPMPASMPGTLPNPTMPGSSAVSMPMERQMSVNSNLLGMQGPNLSNPCASPQVQPMHSEAKMVNNNYHHPSVVSRLCLLTSTPTSTFQLIIYKIAESQLAYVSCLGSPRYVSFQNEVSMLKNEVAQLKQLLLTHKDCPITAMQKESQGYLSPESSPPASPVPACSQHQVIQHNTVTTSSAVSEVVGSSTLSQLTTHRTDLNPIL
uniref:cyclic AMP-responsive element-binding protein 5 n=1 Tax=Panthera onca TaxID=9690 RepID=UPI0029533A85|nr:cyclic AMP-responsive element-binding protein 5 [Panthera onca]